jgi:biopolymer transport protein ExbB/TolQ
MEALSLSPQALFAQAGAIGKGVMLVLAFASVCCWALILEAAWGRVRIARALKAGAAAPLLQTIVAEGARAADIAIATEGVSERRRRVSEAMERAGRELIGRASSGLSVLAIISSTAPFIGLFGTVWGVMTSFASIAQAKDTSLAVVAPGIAEALAATAFGLAAAIPASVGYTRLGAAFSQTAMRLSHFIEEQAVSLIVARQKEQAP